MYLVNLLNMPFLERQWQCSARSVLTALTTCSLYQWRLQSTLLSAQQHSFNRYIYWLITHFIYHCCMWHCCLASPHKYGQNNLCFTIRISTETKATCMYFMFKVRYTLIRVYFNTIMVYVLTFIPTIFLSFI